MLKIFKRYNLYVSKRCFANKEILGEMKYLNVAEKNDAAKTIAGQLSSGTARRREGLSVYNKIYEFEATVLGRKSKMVMTSVSGHLLTFEFLSSYRNWNNVDPQSLFDAPVRKTCSDNFINIKKTLEREVRSCQGLIIWTDCDREGENIGFEIIDVCRAIKPNITVYRAIFSEITGAAVKRALQNLTQPDKRQSDAVDIRSELDLRTGAAITRFQTMRLQKLFPEKISNKLISYGSCQIPTLGFVAERYKEIEAFVSEPFWKIKGKCGHFRSFMVFEGSQCGLRMVYLKNDAITLLADKSTFAYMALIHPKKTTVWYHGYETVQKLVHTAVKQRQSFLRNCQTTAIVVDCKQLRPPYYRKLAFSYPSDKLKLKPPSHVFKSLIGRSIMRLKGILMRLLFHYSTLVTHTIEDLTVEFLWARNRLFDKQACEDFYMLVIANPTATVESVTVKPKSKWRPTPLDTVELEKLGSRKLKLSAKEVMTIAEKLYTKGIISYPRTETNMFSKEIDLKSLVEQQTGHGVWGSFAQRVAEWGPNPRNGNKSDQAHPPIHPTKMVPNMDGNEGRVYELICRHFLACVSKDAVGSETIVNITIEGEKFSANGLVIFERNYLDVYVYEKWNAKQIHKYEQGQQFEPTEITMPEGHTTAPPLLTEADLIALMEKHGIGTDATHAEHINTIKERGYIGVVDNGSLVPGVIGMGLYEGYDAMELALAKPMLRAEFEQDLKKICLGEKQPKAVLSEQIVKYKEAYKQIMDKITAMDEKMAQRILETPAQNNASNNSNSVTNTNASENQNRLQELFKCPKCSIAPLALKSKKNQTGFLIGCLNFPDCKNCIWWPDECKDPTVLDEFCRKCGADFKLIKFRFSNTYHKTMFNAPSGWYKMCLRCDAQFREMFNINLESVKRTGPIVADISSIPINYGTSAPPPGADNRPGAKPKSKVTKTKKSSTDVSGETETKTKKPRKTSTTSKTSTTTNQSKKVGNTNIRSYFTAAPQQAAEEIAASELQDMPIDAFFDSNDGFDDLILEAEANMPATKTTTTTTSARTTTRSTQESVLSDDLAAAFNDDDDDVFADFHWGSGNVNSNAQKQISTTTNAIATTTSSSSNSLTRGRSEIDESFSEWLQDENINDDDYVWGSSAKNARLSEIGSTAKRPKVQTSETTIREDNFSWGSSSRIISEETSHNVICTGCHQPAKELSVKKEGPNKGRMFFTCAKSNPCKFFQWSDEIEQQAPSKANSDFGSNSRKSNYSNNLDADNSGTWGSRESMMPANTLQIQCNCGKPANCLTVRKEGPNKGRDFYACTNRDKSCGFFQWADESEQISTQSKKGNMPSTSNWGSNSMSNAAPNSNSWGSVDDNIPANPDQVNCNCNKPASSLTVRKEGPNTGRGFYACSNRDKSCGFFQWADQTEDVSQRSWGSSSSATTSGNFKPVMNKNNSSAANTNGPKGRKCGLCRQEGHTRSKCPRKA